jgi:ribosome-interacting GTPase 1
MNAPSASTVSTIVNDLTTHPEKSCCFVVLGKGDNTQINKSMLTQLRSLGYHAEISLQHAYGFDTLTDDVYTVLTVCRK